VNRRAQKISLVVISLLVVIGVAGTSTVNYNLMRNRDII
jgi:hypothetical protein